MVNLANFDTIFVYTPLHGFDNKHFDALDPACKQDEKASRIVKDHQSLIRKIVTIANMIPGISLITGIGYIYAAYRISKMDPSHFASKDDQENRVFHTIMKGSLGIIGYGISTILAELFLSNDRGELIQTPTVQKRTNYIELQVI